VDRGRAVSHGTTLSVKSTCSASQPGARAAQLAGQQRILRASSRMALPRTIIGSSNSVIA